MQKVNSKSILNKYISETGISELFSKNITDTLELFSFDKSEFLINEGEPSDYLYFLVSGKIKVFSHSSSGKVLFLSTLQGFEVLGETCSLWQETPTASVQSTTNVYCLGISMIKYREILLNDIQFLRYISMNLGKRLSSANNNACITIFDSLESRLASFILKTSSNNIFCYNLTECAELLCTSYRHLLRVINLFCNTKKLKKTGKCYEILDKDYLTNISSSSNHRNE